MIMECNDVSNAEVHNSTDWKKFGLQHPDIDMPQTQKGISCVDVLYVQLMCCYSTLQTTTSTRLQLWIHAYTVLVRESRQRSDLGKLLELALSPRDKRTHYQAKLDAKDMLSKFVQIQTLMQLADVGQGLQSALQNLLNEEGADGASMEGPNVTALKDNKACGRWQHEVVQLLRFQRVLQDKNATDKQLQSALKGAKDVTQQLRSGNHSYLVSSFAKGLACAFDELVEEGDYYELDGWFTQQQEDFYGNAFTMQPGSEDIRYNTHMRYLNIAEASLLNVNWPCCKDSLKIKDGTMHQTCLAFARIVPDQEDGISYPTGMDIRFAKVQHDIDRKHYHFLRFVSKPKPNLQKLEVKPRGTRAWPAKAYETQTLSDNNTWLQPFVSWIADGNAHMQVAYKVLGIQTDRRTVPIQFTEAFNTTHRMARTIISFFRRVYIHQILQARQYDFLSSGELRSATAKILTRFSESQGKVNRDMQSFMNDNTQTSIKPIQEGKEDEDTFLHIKSFFSSFEQHERVSQLTPSETPL